MGGKQVWKVDFKEKEDIESRRKSTNFLFRLPWRLQRYIKFFTYNIYRFLFRPKSQKMYIDTVHEEEVGIVLDRLGLLGKFNRKELVCNSCGKIITQENVYAIRIYHGVIKIYCDSQSCSSRLSSESNSLK